MTVFNLNSQNMTIEKWMHQNKVQIIETFPSVLLDNYHIDCKNGTAFIFDKYLNSCSSCYQIHFFRYYETNTDEYNLALNEWYDLYDDYCNHYTDY